MNIELIKKRVEIFIPVKRLSTRVVNKSVMPFYKGLNLLQVKLNQALAIFPSNKITVVTDVKEHVELAKKSGVNHHFVSTLSNFQWPETMAEIAKRASSEYICIYRITTPFLGTTILNKLLKQFFEQEMEYDSAVSVVKIQERLFDHTHRPLNFSLGQGHIDSQNTQPIYKEICGISLINKMDALNLNYHFSYHPLLFELNPLLGTDINTPEDWQTIQTLLEIPEFRKIINNSYLNEGS